mgnify:CR=1 FL=1
MKSCVVTANYACDPNKVWLYLTKPRCLSCNFQKGKISGTFTALLLGGGDATSVECTLDVNGLGFFTKPEKLLNERLEMLRQTLGA